MKDFKLLDHEKMTEEKADIKTKQLFVITEFYPPDYAPTGQLIQELVTYLGQQGNAIKVFTGQPGYAYKQSKAPSIEWQNGVHVKRTCAVNFWPRRIRGKLISGFLFFLRAAFYGLKNFQKEDILLLTTAPAFLPMLGYFFKSLLGLEISYVCLIYDLYPDVAVELGVVSPKSWIVKLWDRVNSLTWHHAQQVIVLSSSMKERILKKHPMLANKIAVIHNWSNPNQIVPIAKSENWFAHQYNLVEKFTILYSGNMGRCHDMYTILEAAYQLQREPVQFVFIGGGAGYQNCIDTVEAWKLENCLFLPYQDRHNITYSLTACDLSLVSVKFGMEGVIAPSKLYSIMASGRPIAAICEQHSYLRQMINQAQCGKTFDNGDGEGLAQFIRQLALDHQLLQKMGSASRNYLTLNFTLDIIAEQYSRALGLSQTSEKRSEVLVGPNIQQGHHPKLIGQILQQAGLLSALQVNAILEAQTTQYRHLRFGEIAISKGWLKPQTVDFILNYVTLANQALQETSLLLTVELDEVLQARTNQSKSLRIGELALLKGWMNPETMNFVLKNAEQV